jgi:hypothetical protein
MNLPFVKSHYRSRWKGVVIATDKLSAHGDLLTIVILLDRTGKPMRKRTIMRLNEHWVKACEPIDLNAVNPDWLKNNY